MKKNALLEFRRLRESLTSERDSLTKRLRELDAALGTHGPITGPARGGPAHDAITPTGTPPNLLSRQGRRSMSASVRARIAEAQRLRWAKKRAEGGAAVNKSPKAAKPAAESGKGSMPPTQREKLAVAARARWAKVKAAGKMSL